MSNRGKKYGHVISCLFGSGHTKQRDPFGALLEDVRELTTSGPFPLHVAVCRSVMRGDAVVAGRGTVHGRTVGAGGTGMVRGDVGVGARARARSEDAMADGGLLHGPHFGWRQSTGCRGWAFGEHHRRAGSPCS
jgi:hypothetical protein